MPRRGTLCCRLRNAHTCQSSCSRQRRERYRGRPAGSAVSFDTWMLSRMRPDTDSADAADSPAAPQTHNTHAWLRTSTLPPLVACGAVEARLTFDPVHLHRNAAQRERIGRRAGWDCRYLNQLPPTQRARAAHLFN